MGNWTSGKATIHSCPPHRVRAVTEILDQYGIPFDHSEDAETDGEPQKTVVLGDWTSFEIGVGHATELAHSLINAAPEAAFTVYEEPGSEWLGKIYSYVRELGLFTAPCDVDGDPLFTRTQALRLDEEPAEVRRRKLGLPWLTATAAMRPGVVVEPAFYAAHWDRRHAEVIIYGTPPAGETVTVAAPAEESEPAVDAALTMRGYTRATDWTDLDDHSQIRHTTVYPTTAC